MNKEKKCSGTMGWASYPESLSDSQLQGIAIIQSKFPGMNGNNGGILIHEIGHVFTLKHLYHLPTFTNDDKWEGPMRYNHLHGKGVYTDAVTGKKKRLFLHRLK